MSMRILLTGADGQLGSCFKKESLLLNESLLIDYVGRKDLDISSRESVESFFKDRVYDCIINAAAYTKVDLAEEEEDIAFKVNSDGVLNLALAAEKMNALFIHISTDFVFDGRKTIPYKEIDITNPLSVYGKSKLSGEKVALENCSKVIVLRTSWLYSFEGNNFLKTIQRIGIENESIRVISDQIGTPTNANKLVSFIFHLLSLKFDKINEIYNFSDGGECSWYDFASSIIEFSNIDCKVVPIKSEEYPQKAERPKYSVLDKTKLLNDFDFSIEDWKEVLKKEIKRNLN